MRKIDWTARYSKNLEWAKKEGSFLVIGITDFAQDASRETTAVFLPKTGEHFDTDMVFATTESTKAVNEICMPVGGTIVEINKNLEEKPSLINEDPYGEGWLVKIKPDDINSLESLMSPNEYDDYIGALFRKN